MMVCMCMCMYVCMCACECVCESYGIDAHFQHILSL